MLLSQLDLISIKASLPNDSDCIFEVIFFVLKWTPKAKRIWSSIKCMPFTMFFWAQCSFDYSDKKVWRTLYQRKTISFEFYFYLHDSSNFMKNSFWKTLNWAQVPKLLTDSGVTVQPYGCRVAELWSIISLNQWTKSLA